MSKVSDLEELRAHRVKIQNFIALVGRVQKNGKTPDITLVVETPSEIVCEEFNNMLAEVIQQNWDYLIDRVLILSDDEILSAAVAARDELTAEIDALHKGNF